MKTKRAISLVTSWICLITWLAACQAASAPMPGTPSVNPPVAHTATADPSLHPIEATAPTQKPLLTPTRSALATATPESSSPILLPFPPATVAVESADVWDDPQAENNNSHRQTQLILGEQVLVLQTRGEWAEIRAVEQPSRKDPLGYPGWVRRGSLANGWPESDKRLVVVTPSAPVFAQPQAGAAQLIRASLDSRLVVTSQTPGWYAVKLPDGRTGWMQTSAARLSDPNSPLSDRSMLLETARSLVGIPYLWGGTTPVAYDCSGFIYRVFSTHGIKIARDAQDQALLGTPVELNALQPGDLLFYSTQAGGPVTHVALYAGSSQILDAQTTVGITLHPMAEALSSRVFAGARRILP